MTKEPIYSPRQIFAGSILGGPVAVVYFLRCNFQTLGKTSAAAQTLWWGILFNIAIIATMPFLPKHFPNMVFPLAYSWAARLICDSKQLSKESVETSTQFCFQSNWKVFGLGLAFLSVTFLLWLSILLTFSSFKSPTYSVTANEIPQVVSQLRSSAKDGNFAVIMFVPNDSINGDAVNLQYSIEDGVVGFDWVLIGQRNVDDKTNIINFASNRGFQLHERELKGVHFLRMTGSGISEVGMRIIQDFYLIDPNAKLEMITRGFKWQQP